MRYYVVQFLDARAGWRDMPQTASKKQKEVEAAAEVVAHRCTIATRTMQKPKGWSPDGLSPVEPPWRPERFSLSQEVREGRKGKGQP